MGARTRPAVLRRVGPLPRFPHRVRARRTRPSRGHRGRHRALPRRPCRERRAGGISPATDAAADAVGVADAVRSARGGGLPMMNPVSARPVRQRPSRTRQRRHGVRLHRASGAVPGARAGASRASSSNGSTARSPASRTARRRTTFSPSSSAAATPRAITPGALHRGRLFHVQYKPLYEAIGEPNNRHRKPASLGRFVERLMLLDAVLADRHYDVARHRARQA